MIFRDFLLSVVDKLLDKPSYCLMFTFLTFEAIKSSNIIACVRKHQWHLFDSFFYIFLEYKTKFLFSAILAHACTCILNRRNKLRNMQKENHGMAQLWCLFSCKPENSFSFFFFNQISSAGSDLSSAINIQFRNSKSWKVDNKLKLPQFCY